MPKVPKTVEILRTAHLLNDPFTGTHDFVEIQQPLFLKVLSGLHVRVDWLKVSEANADCRRQRNDGFRGHMHEEVGRAANERVAQCLGGRRFTLGWDETLSSLKPKLRGKMDLRTNR